jgi:hypothetical protein
VVQFQINVVRWNAIAGESIQSTQSAQSIVRTMVKELRGAKPGSNGSYPIAVASSSSLTFYSDIDADGFQEQVRYFVDGTTLRKGVVRPSGSPLSYGGGEELFTISTDIVDSPSTDLFEYFDSTYAGTTTPLAQPVNVTEVRLVKITFVIDADPNRDPAPATYSSQVMLRNLKDNL